MTTAFEEQKHHQAERQTEHAKSEAKLEQRHRIRKASSRNSEYINFATT